MKVNVKHNDVTVLTLEMPYEEYSYYLEELGDKFENDGTHVMTLSRFMGCFGLLEFVVV